MAPSQTTTSPRRLRKQALREKKKQRAEADNIWLAMMYEERERYWHKLLEVSYPDLPMEEINQLSISMAFQNRKQRRANRVKTGV